MRKIVGRNKRVGTVIEPSDRMGGVEPWVSEIDEIGIITHTDPVAVLFLGDALHDRTK